MRGRCFFHGRTTLGGTVSAGQYMLGSCWLMSTGEWLIIGGIMTLALGPVGRLSLVRCACATTGYTWLFDFEGNFLTDFEGNRLMELSDGQPCKRAIPNSE